MPKPHFIFHAHDAGKRKLLHREMGFERADGPSRSPEAAPLVGLGKAQPSGSAFSTSKAWKTAAHSMNKVHQSLYLSPAKEVEVAVTDALFAYNANCFAIL